MKKGLVIETPTPVGVYLGCGHEVGTLQVNGKTARTMSYNMEDFLKSCADRYLELAGNNVKMKTVATPFLAEDQNASPQGAPCSTGPHHERPWCKHTFPQHIGINVATGKGSDVNVAPNKGNTGMSSDASTGESKKNGKQQPSSGGTPSEDNGRLQPIAAKVLMKILYAARLCRFDLLRAVCHLATFVSKWTSECDRKLHRLVCYIHSTKHLRMIGWVGDPLAAVQPHLFADADFGGCTATQRSTSGYHLAIRGPSTCFPITGVSKRQSCVSHSTPEAEMVSADFAMRHCGLPGLSLWWTLLTHKPQLHFHEDNTAMIRIVDTGRNPSMRYLHRTHRISVAWLHEIFASDSVRIFYEKSAHMCADIYTKAFTDALGWTAACDLINLVDPQRLVSLAKTVARIVADDTSVVNGSEGVSSLTTQVSTPAVLSSEPQLAHCLPADASPISRGGTETLKPSPPIVMKTSSGLTYTQVPHPDTHVVTPSGIHPIHPVPDPRYCAQRENTTRRNHITQEDDLEEDEDSFKAVKMSESHQRNLLQLIKGYKGGYRIGRCPRTKDSIGKLTDQSRGSKLDNLDDERNVNIDNAINMILEPYMKDIDWDFMIIGQQRFPIIVHQDHFDNRVVGGRSCLSDPGLEVITAVAFLGQKGDGSCFANGKYHAQTQDREICFPKKHCTRFAIECVGGAIIFGVCTDPFSADVKDLPTLAKAGFHPPIDMLTKYRDVVAFRAFRAMAAINRGEDHGWDRTLIEGCCNENSVLSQRTKWSKGCQCIPIDEVMDLCSTEAWEICTTHLCSPNSAFWFSCPCAGGSSWQNYNWTRGEEVREKIRGHWKLFHILWRRFEKIAKYAIEHGASVFVEWPRKCSYWHDDKVRKFLSKNKFEFGDFDGCMYGLVALSGKDSGMPINKPWRVACLNSSLNNVLNKKCDKSHTHTPCEGNKTKGTENYTPEIAKQFHVTFKADVEERRRDVQQQTSMCAPAVALSAHARLYAASPCPPAMAPAASKAVSPWAYLDARPKASTRTTATAGKSMPKGKAKSAASGVAWQPKGAEAVKGLTGEDARGAPARPASLPTSSSKETGSTAASGGCPDQAKDSAASDAQKSDATEILSPASLDGLLIEKLTASEVALVMYEAHTSLQKMGTLLLWFRWVVETSRFIHKGLPIRESINRTALVLRTLFTAYYTEDAIAKGVRYDLLVALPSALNDMTHWAYKTNWMDGYFHVKETEDDEPEEVAIGTEEEVDSTMTDEYEALLDAFKEKGYEELQRFGRGPLNCCLSAFKKIASIAQESREDLDPLEAKRNERLESEVNPHDIDAVEAFAKVETDPSKMPPPLPPTDPWPSTNVIQVDPRDLSRTHDSDLNPKKKQRRVRITGTTPYAPVGRDNHGSMVPLQPKRPGVPIDQPGDSEYFAGILETRTQASDVLHVDALCAGASVALLL